MDLPDNFTIDIDENDVIRNDARRSREWCGSLIGAMAWVSSIVPDETYVFRGHAQDSYLLESSLKRLTKPTTLNRLKQDENKILKSVADDFWFERTFGFVPASASAADKHIYERTIAALQHHGIPTRLLDVTADPVVALYFSIIGSEKVDDMDDYDGEVVMIRNIKESHGLPFQVVFAPQVSERVSAQRSRFIMPTDMGSVEASDGTAAFDFANVNVANRSQTNFDNLVDNYLSGDFQGRPVEIAPNILKFVIPAEQKPTCRKILRSMGVSARTLFPGDEGFRRDLYEF